MPLLSGLVELAIATLGVGLAELLGVGLFLRILALLVLALLAVADLADMEILLLEAVVVLAEQVVF